MTMAIAKERRVDLAQLTEHLRQMQGNARRLVAIAGASGSGKSTFTEMLCAGLNRVTPGIACILAMDGFHFDDRVLEARGHRSRKGAPHTFDVGGLAAMIDRLRADDGTDIAVPVFDRSIEIARAGAAIIPASTRLILVEGNYLLLDDPAWASFRPRFDVSVMLDVPRDTLTERLIARWRGYGFDAAAVRSKLDHNDFINIDIVLSHSATPDFRVDNV
ncbi:MAG: nucleoside/nucleotide kinase family protein [Herbaspirillum sp.]